jgi:hypothetical protein
MTLHIISLPERLPQLMQELQSQSITDYRLWDGIRNEQNPRTGISQSHKQIVRWAKENNLPKIAIAEDDIKFTSKGSYEYFLKNEPEDYDLYLGCVYYGNIKTDNTVDKFSGLILYIINSKYYDKFLATPESQNLDLAQKGKGKFIVSNPFACVQYNGYSYNKKKDVDYDKLLKGRKLYTDV